MPEYLKIKNVRDMPRIPLEGNLDLTYRCNNNCRHCWLRIPTESSAKAKELTFDEIKRFIGEARKMGCRQWNISGGEPMLRPDFTDIFDYITSHSASYSINTNGTLITPKIAGLMRRKGGKMVALYGASAEVHDHITRTPGSFDAVMQGMAYLKEAGAGFTVQLIPMRDNYHQFEGMKTLAQNLSPHWRVGAGWLYLSACGDAEKNRGIMRQRLDPKEVVDLDKLDLSYEEWAGKEKDHRYSHLEEDNRLFATCIAKRRDFHIDPYGHMSFCCFVKNSDLRYDLRKGSFTESWESFIPSLTEKVKGGEEYRENCRSCRLKTDCKWCPVYGYLEHGRFSAKVDYLCDIAREKKGFTERWINSHRRYYQIGGITIQVDSDLPITETTFHPKFKRFQVDGPGEDTISIRHHFYVPKFDDENLGKEVYREPPWAIYRKGNSWIYVDISPTNGDSPPLQVAVFNQDHTSARIYNDGRIFFTGVVQRR